MSAPLVTIGIPCFNNERWLRAAIDSALAQTYRHCEVIVADDGSTDRSLEIATSFGEKMRVIRGEHAGANRARNAIVEVAQGEWLQFLDADDYLEPEKIERQLAEASENADVLYGPVWIETTDPTKTHRVRSELHPERDLCSQWITWELPQTGGCLWRRSALQSIGAWKEGQPCCQEHELYLRAIKAGLNFRATTSVHAVYRIWSEGTLCRKDPSKVVEVKTALIDDMRSWLESRGGWTSEHRKLAGRACFEMARTLARYDIAAAAKYHADRQARGLIELAGPAAPLGYQLVYRTAGFVAAETVAAARRKS